MLMRDASAPATAIHRADYQAPAFWVDTVELCFDLDPQKTRVLNRMTLRRNPEVPQALEGIYRKSINSNPNARFKTATKSDEKKYKDGVQFAYYMIGCYPVAIPIFFAYLIHTRKHEIISRGMRARAMAITDQMEGMTKEERRVARRQARIAREKFEKMDKAGGGVIDSMSFLYEAYKPETYYWELCELFSKITQTCVAALIAPGTPMQITFCILLAIFFIKLYGVFLPFRDETDNMCAELGQYQIFFTFFSFGFVIFRFLYIK
jgi:hypothetical protein